MKASDIPDREPLMVVVTRYDGGIHLTGCGVDGGPGVSRYDIATELGEYPEKVLLAKLRSLVKRGLLDGCACGCRGDFTITDAGRALLSD